MAKFGPDQRPGYKEIGVIAGYDKWALTYDRDPNPLIAAEEEVTLDFIGDVQGQLVLDLGCGTGRYCVLLTDRGAEVVGIDPSQVMVNKARKKVSEKCQFELYHGVLKDIKFLDGYFDLIVSALIFSHIPEIEPVFDEMTRVLKPGGRIVISDFHPYWPVFGHGYTEFFDEQGQEYRITSYPHLFEEYFSLSRKFDLRIEDIREPLIDDRLIQDFPALRNYRSIPLALILKLRKSSL